ncbi:MAG: hypothetical protein H8E16_12650, partial [Flavobacteriales bacterium]|nr:hypothetical protein [Flavobacteriales bacterium]
MANTLKQTVFQIEQESIPQRMIVQYIDENEEQKQTVTFYEDLTESEKTIFDNFY